MILSEKSKQFKLCYQIRNISAPSTIQTWLLITFLLDLYSIISSVKVVYMEACLFHSDSNNPLEVARGRQFFSHLAYFFCISLYIFLKPGIFVLPQIIKRIFLAEYKPEPGFT